MNYYEHTIIIRQDLSLKQIESLQEKYTSLIKKHKGSIAKIENWGLINMSYEIKQNRKGNYLHFKLEGNTNTIQELEKNENIDKNILRFLTIKVKKLNLDKNYFEIKKQEQTINNKVTKI